MVGVVLIWAAVHREKRKVTIPSHRPGYVADHTLMLTQALLNIEMNADLRSEFSWNTKQLYVYVLVEFETEKNAYNEMVIWNRIIQHKQNANMNIRKLQRMFPFVISDQGESLLGREFNVTVAWDVMPHVGRLYKRHKTFHGLALPEYYIEPKKSMPEAHM